MSGQGDRDLIERAAHHQILGLVVGAYEAGQLEFSEDNARLLVALGARGEHQKTTNHVALRSFVTTMASAGLPVRLFKGAAAAELYEDPNNRHFADIDLFVLPDEWSSLLPILAEVGLPQRQLAALTHQNQIGLPLYEFGFALKGASFDIHFNPFGYITPAQDPQRLAAEFSTSERSDLADVVVPSVELSLLLAASNLARTRGRLNPSAADAVRILAAERVDWDRFGALAHAEGLTTLTAFYLRRLCHELQLDVGLPLPVHRIRPELRGPLQSLQLDLPLRVRGLSLLRWLAPSVSLVDAIDGSLSGPAVMRWSAFNWHRYTDDLAAWRQARSAAQNG